MVSGGRPFVAPTVPELFSSILRDAPAPLPAHVSSELAAVIDRCLHRHVSERYQRGSDVRAALEAIQAGRAPVGGTRSRLGRHRLAVLPLRNLSGDPAEEYFVDGTQAADLDAALYYFELALQKDSSYARGYVGISAVWSCRQQMGFAPPSDCSPKQKAAVARALELDETLAEAHLALAVQFTWTDWNWTAADPEFRRAIDLNPNYGQARAAYSHYLHFMRRSDEAMAQIQRAMELDPLNPLTQSLYGVALVSARRCDEAIVQCGNALKTAPDSNVALNGLSFALHQTGRYDDELNQERARAMRRGDTELAEALALGHAEGGYQGALRRGSDVLATRPAPNMSFEEIAHFHMRAGEIDRALDWLERGCEGRDPNLPYISSNPNYDPLRSHPRFEALMQRMGLPTSPL